jgi:hypothetical protein
MSAEEVQTTTRHHHFSQNLDPGYWLLFALLVLESTALVLLVMPMPNNRARGAILKFVTYEWRNNLFVRYATFVVLALTSGEDHVMFFSSFAKKYSPLVFEQDRDFAQTGFLHRKATVWALPEALTIHTYTLAVSCIMDELLECMHGPRTKSKNMCLPCDGLTIIKMLPMLNSESTLNQQHKECARHVAIVRCFLVLTLPEFSVE